MLKIFQRAVTRWPPLFSASPATIVTVPLADLTAIGSRVPARRLRSVAPDHVIVSRAPKRTMEFTG